MSWLRRELLVTMTAVFALAVFTYLIFITEPLLHNHATRFPWLIPGGIGSGRWFTEWIGHLHYDADLPIFLPVVSILAGVLGFALILERLDLRLSRVSSFLVLAAALTYPAHLASFYYTFMTPLLFGALLFVGAAFYVTHRLSAPRIAMGAVLILLMMATYQLQLSVFVVAALLAAVIAIMRSPTRDGVRGALLVGLGRAAALVAGGLAYRLSLWILHIEPPRAIEYTSWSELPFRALEIAHASVEHLYTTQPELLAPVKLTLLAVLIAAVIVSLWKVRRSPLAVLAVLVLWPLAVVATKAVFIVVAPDGSIWEYRYNLALGLLEVLALAILLEATPRKLPRLAVQGLAAFVVLSFVQADQLRQGVLLRGQQHDLALANRILDRIETLPDIDYGTTYNLIRVGRYSFYRFNLLRMQGHESAFYRLGDTHMDIGEISDRWVDEDVFRLLGSAVSFKFQTTDPNFSAEVERVQSELLEGRRPWPAPESVFINGDEIIVYMRTDE